MELVGNAYAVLDGYVSDVTADFDLGLDQVFDGPDRAPFVQLAVIVWTTVLPPRNRNLTS